MTHSLSDRVQLIKPSPTLAVTAKAAELRAQGKDVIGLGAGEPDFDTPDHIKAAAIAAIEAGFTKYTAVDGIAELKQAVVDKFKRDNGLDYLPEQISVSNGGKQCLYNLAQAFLNPGDEVIIPAPYWVSYPAMALLAGAKPVVIQAGIEQSYKITPEQLADAITDKTKLIFFNSPSNPSGIAYSKAELTALADVLKQHPNILIATDDMYEHIMWTDEPFCNIVNVCPELYEQTLVFNGVSKVYSMTGWRIGYVGGPANIIAAMRKIQSHSTSNPSSISQKAAVAALSGDQTIVTEMVKTFKQRHDAVFEKFTALPGVKCIPADGTFYLFPDFSEVIAGMDGIADDVAFAEFLLEEAGVALVPGSAFGIPGCLRLSFATSMDLLNEALSRIAKVVRK